jgi:hypothetical protein
MIPGGRKASDMSVVVVVTVPPVPGHRAEVVAAFEAAIARLYDERALPCTTIRVPLICPAPIRSRGRARYVLGPLGTYWQYDSRAVVITPDALGLGSHHADT